MNLTATEARPLWGALAGMELEMKRSDKPDTELLISYLKILLIGASRLKVEKRNGENRPATSQDPAILVDLKNAIEKNFRLKHSPADYANLLNITPAALNRISKNHYNKTLTNLIAERLIIEGKRELYLTAKPVKQIAYELGFNDEFYFSRHFKNNVGISPQYFRDTAGFDKANG
jgi:AraC-like DNA-binding protein